MMDNRQLTTRIYEIGNYNKNGKNMFNKYCHILQYPEKLRNTGLVGEETMESQK